MELENNQINLNPQEMRDLNTAATIPAAELPDAWLRACQEAAAERARVQDIASDMAKALGGMAGFGAVALGGVAAISLDSRRRLGRLEAMRPDVAAIEIETL